jgi:hypothetical protein
MFRILSVLLAVLLPTACLADDARFEFGGDQYAAGQNITVASPVAHDAFMVGGQVSLGAPVTGNAHLAGANINSGAAVSGSVYAIGFSIAITAPVTGTVTALGNSIAIRAPATVGGNVRLAGSTVTLAAPVAGSALLSGQAVSLDASVGGDLSFYGETLSFGPNAKVTGNLLIRAPKPIEVPASVASPERVKYEVLEHPDYPSQAGSTAQGVVGSVWPAVWGTVVWWMFLFIAGVSFIVLAPRLVGALQLASVSRPMRNFGLGVLSFAAALGLVPVFAMTLVGIVLVPFALLYIVVLCGLGYVAGAYFIGLRLLGAFMPVDGSARQVAVLAVSLIVAGLLGMVPVIGWLIGLALTVFGIGLFAVIVMDRWTAGDAKAGGPPSAAVGVGG